MTQLQHAQILVVDAHPDCRELLTLVLTDAGAEVMTARSAQEVIEVLTWRRPNVVLCSLAMPRMSGDELLHHIPSTPQKTWRQLPMIAVTATAEQFGRQQALAAGFADYLTKPFEFEAIIRAVEQLVPSANTPMLAA